VREQFLAECRSRQLEPPTPGQIDRLVASALARGAETVAARVAGRLDQAVLCRLLALVQTGEADPNTTTAGDADSLPRPASRIKDLWFWDSYTNTSVAPKLARCRRAKGR